MQGVDVEMDINIVRGAILLLLIVSFLGVWVWAWSCKRKPAFMDASMLPLEDDKGVVPNDVDPTDEVRPTEQGVNHVN